MKFIEIPFQNKKVGLWYIYYYEGLAFQFAMFLELPLEHFNQVGVRHLVVKDGALTMLYEASWRLDMLCWESKFKSINGLLIGVIKCQHIDMSNLNPNQNRIEIKSINSRGRFFLISIWHFFFFGQPPLFAVFVLYTRIVPQCSTWQEKVISWLTSHCWTLPRKMGFLRCSAFLMENHGWYYYKTIVELTTP